MLLRTRLSVALVAAVLLCGPAAAQFTPGNLVVYRAGDGTQTLANTGNSVFLDQFTTSANQSGPASTIALPADFLSSGTATSEGLISRSPDGQYLAVTGYQRALGGTGSLTTTTGTAVPRSVAIFDSTGAVASRTNLTDFASGNNPRSAVTVDGGSFYATGGAGGTRYAPVGNTTSTQINSDVANLRQVNVFGGQLYATSGSGTARLGTIGTGTPTTSGQTFTNLPGISSTNLPSPYAFQLLDLNSGVPGVDTLYVADDSAGLRKFSLVAGTWTLNGTVGAGADAYRGLTARLNGTTVELYAVRGGNQLVSLADTAGYNADFSSTATTLLATAPTNEAFRGVEFAPAPVPEPATVLAVAAGGLGLLGVVRRRRKSAVSAPAAG